MRRTTVWADTRGDVCQISVALLDVDWEPVAIVTEHVGPFDDLAEVERGAIFAARNLARRQLAGQQALFPG